MSEQDTRGNERSPIALITRGIVKLHTEYFGRGPQRARTEWIGNDGVACTMRNTLTQVELTLIDRGHGAQVMDLRSSFQAAMAPEFISLVQEQTGRTVEAFLSQNHLDPDIAVEIFYLVPNGNGLDDEHGTLEQ